MVATGGLIPGPATADVIHPAISCDYVLPFRLWRLFMKPSVGRVVHYVSMGSPVGADGKQKFASTCRAAIVTEVDGDEVGLCVLNPTGQFFDRAVEYHDGAETPGAPDCPAPHAGGPHRYCGCGWMEAHHRGGTWHWPERVE